MADVTSTLKLITNVGEESIYELSASGVSTGDTMTIPTANAQISTSSVVKILTCNNTTDGTTLGSVSSVSFFNVSYSSANRRFTYTETGKTNKAVKIRFAVE